LPPTLGAWYDRNDYVLVDGLWTATVSGTLGFDQDLIYSKLVKVHDIQKAATRDPDKDKEIKNGIITSDVYNTLQRVCTHKEWAKIRRLRIVTAAAYLKRDRKDGVRQWREHVLKDAGTFTNTDKVGHRLVDKRTRAWYGIALEKFVGKMVEERKRHKARGKDNNLSDSERQHAAGMDGMLKLFVNTVYGVVTSPFFSIGNTVVANNITAKARAGVWMVTKALR
jgi:DNA polymerase elongation subunit (family B)